MGQSVSAPYEVEMSGKRLRLMVFTHGSGKAADIIERLLALPCVEVGAVFVETVTSRRRPLTEKLRRSIRYDGYVETLAKFIKLLKPAGPGAKNDANQFADSHERLRKLGAERGFPAHFVPDFHRPESLALMREIGADLGVVLGTNILKESVFSIPRLGSINLHQGLAPYYRGGPTVFWELFNGESEVGVTVHFVAAKVDTGDIVVQETLPLVYDYAHGLNYEEFIAEYRERLSERAAELVPAAVRMLAEGTANLQRQDLELGKRYRLPVKKEKDELRRRLRRRRREAGLVQAEKAQMGARNG